MKKALVVYYSWSGNTRKIARKIAEIYDADIFEIEPVEPYTNNYNGVVEQAKKEINAGFKPAVKEGLSADGYDTVIVGSPNWWNTIAPPVSTYLSAQNLTGKKVLPFCTHGGGGKGNTFDAIKALCKGAEIMQGYVTYGSGSANLEQEIKDWLV